MRELNYWKIEGEARKTFDRVLAKRQEIAAANKHRVRAALGDPAADVAYAAHGSVWFIKTTPEHAAKPPYRWLWLNNPATAKGRDFIAKSNADPEKWALLVPAGRNSKTRKPASHALWDQLEYAPGTAWNLTGVLFGSDMLLLNEYVASGGQKVTSANFSVFGDTLYATTPADITNEIKPVDGVTQAKASEYYLAKEAHNAAEAAKPKGSNGQ